MVVVAVLVVVVFVIVVVDDVDNVEDDVSLTVAARARAKALLYVSFLQHSRIHCM